MAAFGLPELVIDLPNRRLHPCELVLVVGVGMMMRIGISEEVLAAVVLSIAILYVEA